MPPKNSTVGIKDLILWSLLLPIAGALQQQPNPNVWPSHAQPEELSEHDAPAASAAAHRWRAREDASLKTALGGAAPRFRDTYSDTEKHRTRSNSNERALATFVSPAGLDPAVRAPPAPWSSPSAGLASRPDARSLQDWKVEDLILLATVDGRIHALDRNTGAEKWQLEAQRPMVETRYHAHNKSLNDDGVEQEDPLWIVEPNQDGSIYLYAPGSPIGIQKLGFTVKQLVDRSPIASEGPLAVTYTAEKRSTLYTVDAASGNILTTFSSGDDHGGSSQSCKKFNPLETLDALEEPECEPIGTLTLGRAEYTIRVQDRKSGQTISTIKYSEWVPNNHDDDLRIQHNTAMDSKYIYTSYNGAIHGLDLARSNGDWPNSFERPTFSHRLSWPVARIFDVVRREGDISRRDASLVILPQPVAPSPNDQKEAPDENYERIFVDCTDDGSWFALSESNYPTVTWGAEPAAWNLDDAYDSVPPSWPMLSKRERLEFSGVHQLSFPIQRPRGRYLIDAPADRRLDAPPGEAEKQLIEAPASFMHNIPSLRYIITLMMLGLAVLGVLYQRQRSPSTKSVPVTVDTTPIIVEPEPQPQRDVAEEPMPMVREAEPAQETIFPVESNGSLEDVADAERVIEDDFERIEIAEAGEAEEVKDVNEPEPKPKKKATRGKRGGKKQKEKELLQAEARAKKVTLHGDSATEVISVAASESSQVSGPLQINSLLIHTDKVIGQGSCGTIVFEGSFENRNVAVKRMLSQYYELASQEVSFLQQSDDHPNVIRYFCQQKDDHFLYIAVELCQASLFEVWEAEKARTEIRQSQLRSLKLAIQQDVPKALQQLAAGLYHLHNLRIIHRDIKPQNILVAFPKRNQNSGPRLVISDFGLGKNLPENVSTLVDPTGNAGTSGWKAPELISQPKDIEGRLSQNHSHTGGSESANGVTSGVKRAADIFSLGCLFFWVLTDGMHPYEDENGWQQLRELNIKRDNKKMGVLERWSDAYEPMQLITTMLEHLPERRPTALQVLNHPFFWPAEKRLLFLCDMSDHFEREPRGMVDDGYRGDSDHLYLLECRSEEVIGPRSDRADFLAKLDRHFVDTLGKQRKYSGDRLLDLLRAFRNKKHHYEDMPEDVKKKVGPLPGGYLSYWCNRFPRLLMASYEVVHEAGLQNNDRFKGYFTVGKV